MTLATAFDPRANGLNLIRLGLATVVIVWHSFSITGRDVASDAITQIMGSGAVDGFFAISGFLITASWVRRPHVRGYLLARFLRIVPAFWVCLLVTVALLVPLGSHLATGQIPNGYPGTTWDYLRTNWFFQVGQYDVAGTPNDVPYPGVWNGSIWTLRWELLCYLGVLVLGVAGLVQRRLVLNVAFVLCWTVVAATAADKINNFWIVTPGRFGLMFLAGGLIYTYRDRLPVSRPLLVGAAVVVALATLTPDYRLIAAIPLGYLLIAGSTYVRCARLQLRNDISYGTYIYAFPIQQVLASTGLVSAHVLHFMISSVALTWVVATASWFGVERPANRLRRRPMLEHDG